MEQIDLAVVGAGVAGLAAAHRLRAAHSRLRVVVLEKSRTVGGRAATRRRYGATFDHGAQYFKTPSEPLRRFVAQTLPHDELRDIALPVWTFDGEGRISPGDPAQNAGPKWTYADGIARLAKELGRDQEIRYDVRVGRLASGEEHYTVDDDDGQPIMEARAVLLTPPAPQALEIVEASDLAVECRDTIAAELRAATFRPCLSIVLGYDRPPARRPFYALVNTDRRHPIAWLAFEHLKPDRSMRRQGVLIAQMAPAWSLEHWEEDPESLMQTTAGLVASLLGEKLRPPQWLDRQGWRYALPDHGCDAARLHAVDGLFFAGDYLQGQGRVHLALESGWDAAKRIGEFFAGRT